MMRFSQPSYGLQFTGEGFMFKVVRSLLATAIISFGLGVIPAEARWYAGLEYQSGGGATGAWARISIPPSKPAMFGPNTSSQSNWVSVIPGVWMQTGWLLYRDYSQPRTYWEYCVDNGTGQCPQSQGFYELVWINSNVAWGTIDEYAIFIIPSWVNGALTQACP